jgi:hypothetical protein
LSNKAIAENPHAPLGAFLISCAPFSSRTFVTHLRCALRDLTWVTLSHSGLAGKPVAGAHQVFLVNFSEIHLPRRRSPVGHLSDRQTGLNQS